MQTLQVLQTITWIEQQFKPIERILFDGVTKNPITSLTIPTELQSKDASEHLLSIDITDRPELTIGTLMEVLKATSTLYESVGKVYGYSADQPLTVVKLESGTAITLSFKGVADIVRELKNLLIEMWNKYRHRKPDEIIHHNLALDSTIDILTKIEDRLKKRSLAPEEAQRLKRMALNSTASLFREGALLTAIPSIELVDNYKLLDGFTAPKLLSASEQDIQAVITPAAKSPRKKRSTKHDRPAGPMKSQADQASKS